MKWLQEFLLMGKRLSNNFSRRFGDPARIQIEFAKNQASPSPEKMTAAYVDVLRNLLGREPTGKEILGKVDVSKARKAR